MSDRPQRALGASQSRVSLQSLVEPAGVPGGRVVPTRTPVPSGQRGLFCLDQILLWLVSWVLGSSRRSLCSLHSLTGSQLMEKKERNLFSSHTRPSMAVPQEPWELLKDLRNLLFFF